VLGFFSDQNLSAIFFFFFSREWVGGLPFLTMGCGGVGDGVGALVGCT